ncbi:MAG: threonylcarbamoyl-AMP synthase [Deltaproteobacteria bacterium]|nr:threonylcarbamoyl-AMP synthase [Deltaproteobacteria bacterium]MBW1952609.1 threonylcarbamoyl-AMP synthase [Deltaproteobacteria bacterium]MBW1986264.1 threonylcarbamoyl-AMP synthase [Deltaproteobacteria bacterium]MBW2134161.1 threonylcarbamoyl-AMP synthase [Deltaproteobacteria bacterium]
MILRINPQNPQERLLRQVVQVLADGGLIAYPTDTCYGIGCDLFNKAGIEKIYQLKRRPLSKPFSFICADLKDISEYARVSNYAYKTMKRLLPGPYTFILEGSRLVPKIMLTRRKTAGIRVPDHPICLGLVKLLGHPIISTSASRADNGVMSDPYEIAAYFKPYLDVVVDGGIIVPEPSSVISLIDDVPEIIRVGKGEVSDFE